MIEVTKTPLPPSGRVRAATCTRPTGARLADERLDVLARRLDKERLDAAADAASERAVQDALATAGAALAESVTKLDSARERAEDALPSDAVNLAVEIARQLLKVEIRAENYDLEMIVRATLAASDIKRGKCVVRVHPDDAKLLKTVDFRDETEVCIGNAISRGTVHVETPRGLLVREPNAALEEIREQLLEDLV